MNDEEWIRKILKETGAIRSGHFELVSGYHSDGYINVRLTLTNKSYSKAIGKKIADRFRDEQINVVVSVTSGGDLVANDVARFLDARSVSLQIKGGMIRLPRDAEIKKGENVLILDDVLRAPNGEQMREAINLIREKTGGTIKGIATVVDRTSEKIDLGVKTESLAKFTQFRVWPGTESCPLCRKGVYVENLSQLGREELTKEEISLISRAIAPLPPPALAREDAKEPPEPYAVVLGSYDHFILMDHIARIVVRQGIVVKTSRQLYLKNRPDLNPPVPIPKDETKSLNQTLAGLITNSHCAIIIYAGAAGQFIETAWCAQHQIPSLGILPLRPAEFLTKGEEKACQFLTYIGGKRLFFCNKVSTGKWLEKPLGGWMCEEQKRCPFPEAGLSKMILDYYTTSPRMFLIGADNFKSFEKPISVFLKKLQLSVEDLT